MSIRLCHKVIDRTEPQPGEVLTTYCNLASGHEGPCDREPKDPPSITCPKCGRTSYHPRDVSERYCGNCHQFHENTGIDQDDR